MTRTLGQFAGQLEKAATNVRTAQRRAIEARALAQKTAIVAAARTRNRLARPSWVRYAILDDDTAVVRLWGGMAKITELGSYHQPSGYVETPKQVTARRRTLAKRRGVTINESGLMRTPYGPRPRVKHPPIRPRPFWKAGVEAGRKPGRDAYQKVIDTAITSAFKL